MRTSTRSLRYVLEPRQGLAHARNTGIAAARADIVAFTDDDVMVAHDWVLELKRNLDAHLEVDCVAGRSLPVWPSDPPAWLTRLHWVGPLALQDYGDEPFIVDARRPICLAGANLAFRKRVFARLGGFSPEFGRSEDTEFMLRFWRAGAGALYVPAMMAHAAVQRERLTKAYHRQWHTNNGKSNARMAMEELTAPDGSLRPNLPHVARVLGVPRFAIRLLAAQAVGWLMAKARRHEPQAFWHETQTRELVGYMCESRARFRQPFRDNACIETAFLEIVTGCEARRTGRVLDGSDSTSGPGGDGPMSGGMNPVWDSNGPDAYDRYVRAEWELFDREPARKTAVGESAFGLSISRVLDIGCGAGQQLRPFLSDARAFGVGIDLSSEVGRAGRELFARAEPGSRVAFVRAAAESLPLDASSFDVVICRLALPYTDNARTLAEVARVLRPAGTLLLKFHHARYYAGRLGEALAARRVRCAIHACRVLLAGSVYHLIGSQPRGWFTGGRNISDDVVAAA